VPAENFTYQVKFSFLRDILYEFSMDSEANMRIDAMINGAAVNTQVLNGLTLKELTSRLSPGDIVRAQILEFVANEVLLKLFDSTTLQASVPDGFEGEVGKYTNFVVKESLPDRLVLEEQKNTVPKVQKDDGDILKALSKMGVSQSDDNIKLAKTIIENKLPLTKEFFDNTSKLLQSSKEIDIPKAIIMEANKIEATPESIKQLGLLEKGSVSLSNQLKELVTLLEDANNSFNKSNQNDISSQNLKMSDTLKSNERQTALVSRGVVQENLVAKENSPNQKATISSVTSNIEGEKNNVQVPTKKAAESKLFDAQSFLKQLEDSLGAKNDLILDNSGKETKPVEKVLDRLVVNKEVLQENAKKIAIELKNDIEKLYIKPENMDREKNIELEKNIKTMGENLENIKEEISSLNFNNKEVILQKVDNILNQLRFINDVKSFGYYIPIPVKLNGVLKQADLYVLKRNKNKKVNPEDATIFLALDTSNMGRVETLLSINKKSISLNMRIEEKEYENYIRTRFVDLFNLLSSKGYKLTDIKYRQINEPVNMFNVNKVVNNILTSNSSGVDIRL